MLSTICAARSPSAVSGVVPGRQESAALADEDTAALRLVTAFSSADEIPRQFSSPAASVARAEWHKKSRLFNIFPH